MVASIGIWPGDAELPDLPEPTAAATGGAFDAEAVRARVAAKQSQLQACFADARRSDAALWGRLALALILEVDGSVHQITEVESHFPNASAARCVEVLLANTAFPGVSGKPFTVVVPIRLAPVLQTTTGSDADPSPSVPLDDAGTD
jgi:hypothetical protein